MSHRPSKTRKLILPKSAPEDPAQGWLTGFLGKFFPTFRVKSEEQTTPHRTTHNPESVSSSKRTRTDRSNRSRPHSQKPQIQPPEHDPDFPMIAATDELEREVQSFSSLERIALDTEADSLHCYFDKLCLVQISIPGKNLLIDPLSGISLAPLFQSLQGKTVVIHSADYDLRLLRKLGFEGPTVLFDTMIAARLLGAREFGLAALLHQHFGVTLAKASQKANWGMRPLPREMLEYAVNDTLNLLELAHIQETKLRELGRYSWFEQMCERQIRTASIIKEKDPDTIWRISGYADLTPRGMAILRELWLWRDHEAQSADRPAFHVMNNDGLIECAARFDKGESVDPRYLRNSRRTRFFEAAEGAIRLPEADWPKIIRKPRLRTTQEQEHRFRELRKHRDTVAERLQIDPTLIAPKALLEQLSRNEEGALESLLPWQRECLPPLG